MASIKEYRCEICGTVTGNPAHWFVIHCGRSQLAMRVWDADSANAPDARHLCGEADAQIYISRWFQSMCSPPKPDYASMPSGSAAQG